MVPPARGGRSTGAVDGVLSLLSKIDQFLFFYKVDANLLVCLLKGFYDPYYEQVEANFRRRSNKLCTIGR